MSKYIKLPVPGYSRLTDVLRVFPVSRSTWYAAMANGQIARPSKFGRSSFWSNEYLNELIEKLERDGRIAGISGGGGPEVL